MLTWSEVKPIVRAVLAPALSRLGFGPPARAMWRHRPQFVDVIWFESGQGMVFVELGCTPRVAGVGSPKPSECRFRVSPIDDLRITSILLAFADDEDAQREAFARLAPQLAARAERWFAKFDTVASAREALEANGLRGPNHVTHARPGSPAYLAILAELEQVANKV